jgi:hypothetical protein
MTGLNHALTGATAAAAINRPLLSLPAALVSHFAVDIIPHWNYGIKPHSKRQMVLIADLSLSIGLLIILSATVNAIPYIIFLGGLLAITPDFMWMRFFVKGRTDFAGDPKSLINRIRKFHLWIQWSETSWGIYVEALWFISMLYLVYQI